MSIVPGALFSWLPLRFIDPATGEPVTNGTVEFFNTGLNTHKDTFSAASLDPMTANPNPIDLNAWGVPVNGSSLISVFSEPGGYDVKVFDSDGNQLYERVNVENIGQTFAAEFSSILMAGARDVDASGGYAIADTDNYITVVTAGTITLPASATRLFPIGIKNLSAGALTLIITGGETFDGSLTSFTVPAASTPTFPGVWWGSDVVAGSGYFLIASTGL